MFYVFGINHKKCPVELREKFHFSEKKIDEGLSRATHKEDVSECVILSTCNRVEVYLYAENLQNVEDWIQDFMRSVHGNEVSWKSDYGYIYTHKDAVRHVYKVATGLDSLVLGENEILGQMRDAFKKAHRTGAVHSILYRLMEKALKLGKDARSQTKINEGAVSIPTVVVELAEKIFGKLRDEKIMVMGSGEMSRMVLEQLSKAGADAEFIVSRNQEKGAEYAQKFHAKLLSFENWDEGLRETDILVTSTASSEPVVKYEKVRDVLQQRKHQPLFIIDIAVPRDVESDVHKLDDVYLYDVDDLKSVSSSNLKLRRKEIEVVEGLIESAVIDFYSWVERLEARPTMRQFETFLDQILREELEELGSQSDVEDVLLQSARDRIKAKLMHHPFAQLKDASKNGGVKRYLEAIQSLFRLK